MNYLVAVLSDRQQAEAAYSELEREQVPIRNVAILGQGYQSADDYGLIDPTEKAGKLARLMSFWLVPFGFMAGFSFSYITNLHTFAAWAGEFGDHLVGGLLGAISGAMGSFFVGGSVGLTSGSGDALPYRNRLSMGKYLVVVAGNEVQNLKASGILKRLNPENLQGYSEY